MPLIIICGLPSSGKTSRTNSLVDFFENCKNIKTCVVSEHKLPSFQKNEIFNSKVTVYFYAINILKLNNISL